MNSLYIITWFILLVLCIHELWNCDKPKVEILDCDCGVVTANNNNGIIWIVSILYNCDKDTETTIWHFPLDEFAVGDTICKLKQLDSLKSFLLGMGN